MINDYIIFTDASADVALDVSNAHDVHFISMPCEADGNIFDCTGVDNDEKLKMFYSDIRTGSLPKTTQITPFIYEEIFTPFLESGKSVLYLALSSGLSSTFESAKHAAESLNTKFENAKLLPIDSIGATGAMGILTERMIKNREAGLSAEDNQADIEELKHHIYTTCYVEDLHHLKRGGRIGAATAVIGAALKIKPIIKITADGKLETNAKPKGERKAIMHLSEVYADHVDLTSDSPVYISDADNTEMADIMEAEIKKTNPNADIRRRMLSPIIGTHLGPESVVISFVMKD